MEISALAKVFSLTVLGAAIAAAATPALTSLLYRLRMGKQIRDDGTTPVFSKLHAHKAGTPTMGGILMWGTVAFLAIGFWVVQHLFGTEWAANLAFLNRRETLLPLGALLGASLVGLLDDFLDVRRLGHKGRGIRFRHKFFLYLAVAAVGAWWFYSKLGFSQVHVPFYGDLEFGLWYVPFFIAVVIGTSFSVNETDGLDGLAGGTLLFAFAAIGVFAFLQGRVNLAGMIGVVCGSLMTFLWFNVHPARFFMGDTGSMGLGVLLAVCAFLTGTPLLLPVIGFVFVLETLSIFVQISYRKLAGKKLLLSAPMHNHLQAIGWPESKVTMRLWVISIASSVIGVCIYFAG